MDNINININTTTYEELRAEWTSGLTRVMAKQNLGDTCYNCGSDEGIELHHVVPLKLGGTNTLSNIVVLCHRCHCAAHQGRHIRDYCNKEVSGRPRKSTDDEIEQAFSDYLSCKIGTAECKKRLKLSPKSKIGDTSYYKEFLKARKIDKFRNNIDIILNKRGNIKNGDKAGYIIYNNGDVINIYYGE